MNEQHNGLASEAELFTGKSKRRYMTFVLPVKGKTIRIQSLMEDELSKYQSILGSMRTGTATFRSRLADAARRLIVLCLVDGAGNRILNNTHVARMGLEWDAADVQALYEACVKHVGIRTGDIEELVKNSEATSVAESLTEEPATPDG